MFLFISLSISIEGDSQTRTAWCGDICGTRRRVSSAHLLGITPPVLGRPADPRRRRKATLVRAAVGAEGVAHGVRSELARLRVTARGVGIRAWIAVLSGLALDDPVAAHLERDERTRRLVEGRGVDEAAHVCGSDSAVACTHQSA